jgi:membrane-bound lytic murein transglycosylase D
VEKYQTTDLVEIIKKNNNSRFGFASGSFYASYLAALEVEANAKEIFGNPRWAQAVGFHEERATKPISYNSLSSLFEENKVRMDLFNPHFNRPIRNQLMPIPKGARVRVPIEKKDDFAKVLSTSPAIVRTSEASHQVAAGENLSTIARTYGVSLTSILQMNDLPNANSLKPGQILLIPKASD